MTKAGPPRGEFNSLQTGQNTTSHATTDKASMHWDQLLPCLLCWSEECTRLSASTYYSRTQEWISGGAKQGSIRNLENVTAENANLHDNKMKRSSRTTMREYITNMNSMK